MIHVDIYTGDSILENSFSTLDEALRYIRDLYNNNIQNINIYEDTRISDFYGSA